MKLTSLLEAIFEGACGEIDEADGAIGIGISTGLTIAGYCTGTVIAVSSGNYPLLSCP